MLAFKSALADRDALPTVIYDEIDTGVSGRGRGAAIGSWLHQTAGGIRCFASPTRRRLLRLRTTSC